MKITVLSIVPPPGASSNPKVTHELLASVLAKYSRSNDGLDVILQNVDVQNPEASIAKILKFVDYGHASIGGLTGGIPIAIDNITMYAAYFLFLVSQMADGQEASSRYINMTEEGLPNWIELGFTPSEAEQLQAWAKLGLGLYHRTYKALDQIATEQPDLIRIPEALANKPAAVARLRKNYALDRARYFLPFALKTNVAIVQSARMWTETISALYSANVPELKAIADALKKELAVYVPNLIRHARTKPGWRSHMIAEHGRWKEFQTNHPYDSATKLAGVDTHVDLFSVFSDADIARSLRDRENRYDRCGIAARDTTIRCQWNGMAIAELRDLNRHRTGSRFSDLTPLGFYIPAETRQILEKGDALAQWETQSRQAIRTSREKIALRPYTLALGTQIAFTHTMQFDKFVYEAELRTGAGAHFRYAKHLNDAIDELAQTHPLTAAAIQRGEAEPE